MLPSTALSCIQFQSNQNGLKDPKGSLIFLQKYKEKYSRMSSATILNGSLRVEITGIINIYYADNAGKWTDKAIGKATEPLIQSE